MQSLSVEGALAATEATQAVAVALAFKDGFRLQLPSLSEQGAPLLALAEETLLSQVDLWQWGGTTILEQVPMEPAQPFPTLI